MDKKGFTLLELLIVIIILGVLASIAIPRYFGAIAKARESEARGTLSQLRQVEQAYFTVNNAYVVVAADADLSVDLDGDGTDDISFDNPQSANFNFSATITDGVATTLVSGTSYTMAHTDGLFQ